MILFNGQIIKALTRPCVVSRNFARGGGGRLPENISDTFLSLNVFFSPHFFTVLQLFINGLFKKKHLFLKVSVGAQHIQEVPTFSGGRGCKCLFL